MIEKAKTNNQLLKNRTQFLHILLDNIKDYNGKYEYVICYTAKIYKLLCNLLESEDIVKKDRHRISSTIAYFILPKDVFPEEVFGVQGYIDDIYLSLNTLKLIEARYGINELLKFWDDTPESLKNLLGKEYEKLDKELNYILNDMLEYVGVES